MRGGGGFGQNNVWLCYLIVNCCLTNPIFTRKCMVKIVAFVSLGGSTELTEPALDPL